MEIVSNLLHLALFLALGAALVVTILCLTLGVILTHPPRVTPGVAMGRGWHSSPADLGVEFEDWVFDPLACIRLPVWEIRNPRNADGPVVIVSHCWGGSRTDSLQRLPLVFDHASRVILYDLRSHGEARGSYSHLGADEVDDLLKLMDRVAPDEKILLYGFSMGAGISIAAAARDPQPERVIGVVADGPYRWAREPVNAFVKNNGLPVFPVIPIVHRVMCALFIRNLRDSERAQFASNLRCPLLVLHGSDDPVCPINSALEVAQAAGEVEFVIIPRGGHLDLHHRDAKRYLETVATFARRCSRLAGERDGAE